MEYELDVKLKELVSFRNRMLKYKDYSLTFLYHPKVPPDNNGSERAIRNIKSEAEDLRTVQIMEGS